MIFHTYFLLFVYILNTQLCSIYLKIKFCFCDREEENVFCFPFLLPIQCIIKKHKIFVLPAFAHILVLFLNAKTRSFSTFYIYLSTELQKNFMFHLRMLAQNKTCAFSCEIFTKILFLKNVHEQGKNVFFSLTVVRK